MTITREQVADLREGDVVELTCPDWPDGSVIRGALHASREGALYCCVWPIRFQGGDAIGRSDFRLTVVSRAPRPLYVNHPRTEPVPGDVANWPDPTKGIGPWFYVRESCRDGVWWSKLGKTTGGIPLGQMRLLIDGETGQVVP